MKIACFFLIMFSYTVNAQFKTQYNNIGEPITEIIDPLMMKQGKWTYYDNNNQIIRQENYFNNELIDRKYFSNTTELIIQNLIAFQVEKVNNIVFPNTIHGEALINENGEIIKISFYINQDNKSIRKHKKNIKLKLKSIAKDLKKTIIIF